MNSVKVLTGISILIILFFVSVYKKIFLGYTLMYNKIKYIGDESVKIGLVLEGGACKGIFTAGVLDYWMEQKLIFPYVVSVSAGTCNALDYLSNQAERTKKCMLSEKQDAYFGIRRFLKTGRLFDLERVFSEFPYKQFPFDWDTYFSSPMKNEIVVTNCRTGKAEYLEEKEDGKKLMLKGRASSSLPILSDMVEIDNEKYLDGGLADSIPVERAIEVEGCDKAVVIMTHNEGYIPNLPKQLSRLYYRMYHKYPDLLETIRNRPQMYKKQLETMERYEKQGKAFVIRPRELAVRRMESDMGKMESFYSHGYKMGQETYEKMLQFMKET